MARGLQQLLPAAPCIRDEIGIASGSDPPAFNQSAGGRDEPRPPPDPVKRRGNGRLLLNGLAVVLAVALFVWLVLR